MAETKAIAKEDKLMPDGFHVTLYAIFFAGLIFSLVEYGRMPFETMGIFFSHLAMAFFGAILWTMQKVKLFNWQSLLTTVAYAVYAVFYRIVDGTEPVTSMAIIAEIVSGWILVMLLTDIAITRRVRVNKKFTAWTFALLVVTTIYTLIDRNGSFAPIVYLYFVVLCFIPISGKEWKKVLDGLFIAGLITFIAVSLFSYIGDPFFKNAEETLFMTKADLSQFYAMILALAVYGIFYAKDKDGRFSPLYVFFAGWSLLTFIMILIKGCASAFPGIIFMAVIALLFGYKIKPLSKFFIRLGITVAVLAILFAGTWFVTKKITAPGFDADGFWQSVDKSPLSYMGSLSEELTDAVFGVQYGGGAVEGVVKPNTPGALINLLTGSRLDLLPMVMPMVGWGSHVISASGDNSFILSLRNQFIQYLYEFGYFAGGLNILLFVAGFITAIVQTVRTKRVRFLFPVMMYAMTFGVWINVSSGVLYPLGFVGMLSLLPVFVDLKNAKKKPVKEMIEEDTESDSDVETNEEPEDAKASEEEEEDMVEGKNTMAAKFFAADHEDEKPKKHKKAKIVEEKENLIDDDEEEEEIGRPTDRKKLEDVQILNTAELSGLVAPKEKENLPAGHVTEEILTLDELEDMRRIAEEGEEKNE